MKKTNTQKKQTRAAIARAIKATATETQFELASLVGVSSPAISRWIREGRIEPTRAAQVEAVTEKLGAKVPRSELCPEFPW